MKCCKEAFLLYAVTDRSWLGGRTLAQQVEDCLKGGATMVQLREKDLGYDAFLAEAAAIKALCGKYGAPFIVNDNAEVAKACGADGLHVGQGDMHITKARQLLGSDKLIGVSAGTVDEALSAEQSGADYLGVGAVFPTSSKRDADDVSIEVLTQICRTVSIPVVAIGGINRHNIPRLKGTGIHGAAVISALFAENDIESAARALRAVLLETITG